MATFQQFLASQGLSFGKQGDGAPGGGFLTFAPTDGITAFAGGGQSSAVQLTTQLNTVTTVATAGDSVKLPTPTITNAAPAGPQDNLGNMVIVSNQGAKTLAVFPDSGASINGGSANASVNVASGEIAIFYQTSALTWFTGSDANKIFANVTLTGLLFNSAATGISGGTTRTQAGATALAKEFNRVDTSTAAAANTGLGDGVALMAAAAGLDIMVWNNTVNPIQLYGNGSDTVNGVAGATGISMPPNSVYLCTAMATGGWIVDGTGTGNAGNYPTSTAIDGMTAHAGGGQGSAVLLPAEINRVTTVATGGDSVVLPPSAPGMSITVINAAAANSMNVFPSAGGTTTEKINALSANTAYAQTAAKVVTFYCTVAGQWHTSVV